MSAALIALAIEVGAPLVRRILSDRLGLQNARLAEQVVGAVAERLGVEPGFVDQYAQDHPEEARAAISEVERMTPEIMQVALAETRAREALLLAETAKGGWHSAWRPAAMYMLGFLWLWNVIFLHVLNAIFKIALPPMDHMTLLQLTGIYMTLYMGGHTAKEVAKAWKGAPRV